MKVMVLGGGNCQLNLIERLKKEGDEVILIDYLPDCPGAALCDTHIMESTFDTEAVLAAAKEHGIDAIITLGTDQPIYTAAVVADELRLPFYLTPEQALTATNKRVMKKIFMENGIPSVQYRLIPKDFSDGDIEGIPFPAVIKPVDSQGQRGIYKVDSAEKIRRHIADTLSFSREGKALLERYYESDEVTVNGWLDRGKLTLLSVVDRVTLTSSSHIGICIAHNFPSLHLKTHYDEIGKLTRKIVDVFGFENGPVYFQYLIGEEGIKVNEIAMRIGGAYEDITLPMICGMDVSGMLINCAKGLSCGTGKLEDYSLLSNDKFISTQMFFLKSGTVKKISYDAEGLSKFGVSKIYLAVKGGDTVGGIENATARAGYFIAEGVSYENLSENIEKAYDNLMILDGRGSNIVKRYSSYPDRYKFAAAKGLL